MSRDAVRNYYEQYGEREWARLDRPEDGALEFAINSRTIAAYLPDGARILDIGGGPGRYALWLAERGHRVTLADLSPGLLGIAREQAATTPAGRLIEEIVEADACDLSRWPDSSFDAVLALGPFYHLPEEEARERAAAELARVLKPGGFAFVALMPRLSFLRRTIADRVERRHLGRPKFVRQLLDTGTFNNDEPGRFTGGYGARPEEIAPFFARFGFAQETLLASQSVAPDLQRTLAELAENDPQSFETTLVILLEVASEPSILGMSSHLLYVGKRA